VWQEAMNCAVPVTAGSSWLGNGWCLTVYQDYNQRSTLCFCSKGWSR